MRKNRIAAGAAISIMLSAAACSRSHTYESKDGAVSVEQGKDGTSSVHAVAKDGSSVDINSGKAVTDYPGDVPLYAGKASMDVKSAEKHSRALIMQTPDSMDKVSGFYKSELEGKGWKVETSLNTEKMVMYKASKDNRDLLVQIGADDPKQTTISQTLADK